MDRRLPLTRTADRVDEADRAGLLVYTVLLQRQSHSRGRLGDERNTCAEQVGMIPTSTVSTSPSSARLRKSDPPPNSQMSLPDSSRSDFTSSFQFSLTIVTFL